MAEVSSLWVGKPLTRAHKLALASFVYYGHSIKLYVYDMNLKTPPGVIKADANEIVPESDIFLHYGRLAPFADYFRYKMIQKTGEMWVDADTICMSEYFFEDKDYAFIEELPDFYAQGILKMPADSELCEFLNERASELRFQNIETVVDGKFHGPTWIFLGPKLFTEGVKKFSLEDYAQPFSIVSGVDISVTGENPYDLLWNPRNAKQVFKRFEPCVSITFFNSLMDIKGLSIKLNSFPRGSVMWELQNKFVGN